MTSPAACLASSQATTRERKNLVGSGARIQNQASVLSSAQTCCPQRPASSPVEGDGSQGTQVQLLPLPLPGHVTPDGQNRRLMLLAGGALPPLLSFSRSPPRDAPCSAPTEAPSPRWSFRSHMDSRRRPPFPRCLLSSRQSVISTKATLTFLSSPWL